MKEAPPIDIEESKNLIRTHAKACYPYECCGLIFARGKKQDVLCGRNIASDPRHTFSLHPEDYAHAEDQGEILALYHSHCDEPPNHTPPDKVVAEKHELASFIISLTKQNDGEYYESWGEYKPCGWKADLIGRPFVDGALDCVTILQDWFQQEEGIELPDIPHVPNWWKENKKTGKQPENLFMNNLRKNGFVRVFGELQRGDVILMQIDAKVPNHCAIYIGDYVMLHHPPGQLSGTHPYASERGFYALNTIGIWRHKKLFK